LDREHARHPAARRSLIRPVRSKGGTSEARKDAGCVITCRALPISELLDFAGRGLRIAHGTVRIAGSVSGFASRFDHALRFPTPPQRVTASPPFPCLRRGTPNLAGRPDWLSPQSGDPVRLTLNLPCDRPDPFAGGYRLCSQLALVRGSET
jgi:hypothetical protein